nr:MAG TPA: hypothetical protein [Caudoviricetes sp.]
MCGIWKVGRVCRKVLQKRSKSIDFRSHSDKQLHKQGRTKGVYNGCSYSYTGVCRRQGSRYRTGKFKAVIIKCRH